MSYSVRFSSPLTYLKTWYGVVVVSDKHVFAYFSTYSKGCDPTRSDILSKPDFIQTFKSLNDFSSAVLRLNRSINFYDYEEI